MKFIIGFAWLASAIKVFSNTYNAMTTTYSKFPEKAADTAISPGSVAGATSNIANSLHKIPVVGPLIKFGDRLFGTLFAGGQSHYVSSEEIARIEGLKAPPMYITRQLKSGLGASPENQVKVAQNLAAWALKNGWTDTDVGAFLKYYGYNVF